MDCLRPDPDGRRLRPIGRRSVTAIGNAANMILDEAGTTCWIYVSVSETVGSDGASHD